MAEDAEKEEAAVAGDGQPPALSKSARKKQHKQERLAARKAAEKERQHADVEGRRHEWEEALAAALSEEARIEMVAARRERLGQRAEERGARAERLWRAAEGTEQKVVLDLEFGDLMRPNEIHSLPTLPCPATPDPAATYAPDVAQPRRSPAATNARCGPSPPTSSASWPPSLSRHAVVGRDTQWSLRGRIMKENTQDRDWEGAMSFKSTRFFWPNSLTFGIKFQFKDSMPNS